MSSAKLVDSRPLSDRSFQAGCIKQIIEFLEQTSFDRPISYKQLQTPSAKDYILIVNHLARLISNDIEFPGRLEEDIPNFFKNIGYPFPISKNSLLAIGAPNTWPSLLASLSWLVSQLQLHDMMETESEGRGVNEGYMTEADVARQLISIYESYVEGHDYRQEVLDFKARYQSELEEILLTTTKLNRALQMTMAEREELLVFIKSPQLMDNELAELECEKDRTGRFDGQLAVIAGLKQEQEFLAHDLVLINEDSEKKAKELMGVEDMVKRQEVTSLELSQMKSQIESTRRMIVDLQEKGLIVKKTNSEMRKTLDLLKDEAQGLNDEIVLLETRLNLLPGCPDIPYDLRPRLNLEALSLRGVTESQLVSVNSFTHLHEVLGELERKNMARPDQILSELSVLKQQLNLLNDSTIDLDSKIARHQEQGHHLGTEETEALRLNIDIVSKNLEEFRQTLKNEHSDISVLKEALAQVSEQVHTMKEAVEETREQLRQQAEHDEGLVSRDLNKGKDHLSLLGTFLDNASASFLGLADQGLKCIEEMRYF
jgi:kinetochore protein NDC80